ncbi:hypothetical protein GCM10023116_21440 [Kistimonas scapharcae]|uniref:Uncharacterized protein n=1 Tax=Kistimonas scapharcae TaxID=1036133 RepID=A0ABP8V0V4_9GAMM
MPASDQLTSIKEEDGSEGESIESKAIVTDSILQEVDAAEESGEDVSIDIAALSPDLAPQEQLLSSQDDNDINIQRMLAQVFGLETVPQTLGTEIALPTSSSDIAGIQGASVLSGQQSASQAGCSYWGSRAAASKPASPSPAQQPLSLSSPPCASNASGKSSNSEEASLEPELTALAQMLEIPKGSDWKKSVLKQCMDKIRDLKEKNQSLINNINMNKTKQANERALDESLTAIINESLIMLGKIGSRKQSYERQSELSVQLLSHHLLLNASILMLRAVLTHEQTTPSGGEATTLVKHYLDAHSSVLKSIRKDLNTVKNDVLESVTLDQEIASTMERLKSYAEKYKDLIEGQSGEFDDEPSKTE